MVYQTNHFAWIPRFLIIIFLLVFFASCQTTAEPDEISEAEATILEDGIEEPTSTPVSTETTAPPSQTMESTNESKTAGSPEEVEPTVTIQKSPTSPPTATQKPSPTTIPTATPTSAPQFAPALGIKEPQPVREGVSTPATAIPTAVSAFSVPKGTTNVLLLGSDAPVGDSGVKRTDTMIIVSINREAQTASMISLPRDLYVYIPGGTMNRLNTAMTIGGVELLKQTILYNFGVPIHYFARVDFDGFQEVVDSIGGVDLAVSCQFKDWKIKSPELDPEDEDNWYVDELEPGIHHMDGETALWYARSRLMSNDFDRGRRQQQLLRALLNQGVRLDLVPQAPALWNSFSDTVETDMDIGRMLQLAALAPGIDENGVQNLYLFGKTENWIVPDNQAQVQLPVWEGPGKMRETFQRLFLPPALNKASRAPIFVEIVNATGDPMMAALAAENLAWYGFLPVTSDQEPGIEETTTLSYYAPNFKGSYDWLISWVFHLNESDIELISDDDTFKYDYQVVLGEDYDPCLNQLFAPQAFIP